MEFINIFIITQLIFLLCQFVYALKLDPFQYSELVFGSIYIIIFFGVFGSILTLDMEKKTLNNSILFASFYAIWYYITKKLANAINSDSNGVIYY
jgi:1,4-dihydroxy-2-naphthoate octaprenyltransferase